LATIDFSKAFDSVWHSALFHKLLVLGFPHSIVRWTRSLVLLRGARSRSFRKRRGVPQGSVLGPAFFILYVDNLARTILQGTNHSLYADNLAIWSSYQSCSNRPEDPRPPKALVPEMALPVSPAKCECCFFSTDPYQASHQP